MWSGLPKSKVVGVIGVVAWNWGIVGLGKHDLASLPIASLLTVSICGLFTVSKEAHRVNDVRSLNLPRVSLFEPKVWDLYLLSVTDELLENTVVIPDSIAPCRQFEGSHRVKETGSKSTETSVAEASISLLLVYVFEFVSKIIESFFVLFLHVDIDEHILESTTHQKLKRKIVDVLAILSGVICVCIIPRLNQSISN